MAAKLAAEAFLKRTSGLVQSRTQLLDANQLSKLACTLGSPILPELDVEQLPPSGTPVPPAWHLVYFTPSFKEDALGPDGSDTSFNPDHPFTRRMWAGGRLQWYHGRGTGPADADKPQPKPPAMLRVGEPVTEHTKVVKADPKITAAGEEMIVAGVKKYYETHDGGIALTDQREWIFRRELDPHRVAPDTSPPHSVKEPKRYTTESKIIATSRHRQTPVSLFRFSALTFNAHQIHYSLPWVQRVEGHPELLVHAPLNLILMLELYRKAVGRAPYSMEYRAVSPLYAHEDYTIRLAESGEVWCERDSNGGVCLTGKIE